ncbi:MAG: hypothetical protein E6Q25_01235 [Acinetobacter sp.]|nr:MAG: hypothetical protein E6Q25_01235 [Acinetobacter sp.]
MRLPTALVAALLCSSLFFVACDNTQQRQEIKPAKKLSNDATAIAHEAWALINQVDALLYAGETQYIEDLRKPLRELSNRWRVEIKMTDSVTEGGYALCRKSLTSLDAWARSLNEQSHDIDRKKSEYEHDKKLCKYAIDHPEIGNTSPK